MTVISALYADVVAGQQPMLIADVLVTTDMLTKEDEGRYGKVYIPSIGGMFPHLANNTSIAGLMQKTYVVNQRHVITFAGNVGTAHEFHDAMQKAVRPDDVMAVCAAHYDRLQFIVCTYDPGEGRFFVLHTRDCRSMQPGDYGVVICGGSGESTIRELVLRHQALPFNGDTELEQFGRALCLVSEAIDLDESRPAQTLDKRFGAYYELVFYADERFIKLERVLFSYWKVTEQNGRLCWTPTRMYFHEYANDVLVARRITLSWDGNESAIWQDCYGIGGFGTTTSPKAACSHISASVPDPIMETVSAEFEGTKFRFVSMHRPIVTFEARDGRWFTDINQNQLDSYSTKILETMMGKGSLSHSSQSPTT